MAEIVDLAAVRNARWLLQMGSRGLGFHRFKYAALYHKNAKGAEAPLSNSAGSYREILWLRVADHGVKRWLTPLSARVIMDRL
jgi:hypothetical protein